LPLTALLTSKSRETSLKTLSILSVYSSCIKSVEKRARRDSPQVLGMTSTSFCLPLPKDKRKSRITSWISFNLRTRQLLSWRVYLSIRDEATLCGSTPQKVRQMHCVKRLIIDTDFYDCFVALQGK
jgi:hypothetical protein